MATTTTSSRCDACGANVGPWQATISITSECAHTFNLRFVSGNTTCPACAAAKDTPPAPPAAAFGQSATAKNSSSSSTTTGVFGHQVTANLSNFPGAQPSETSLFGKQQATPRTNTLGLGPEPPAAQPSPCSGCGGAFGRGEATVTSECAHTFHLRCFSFSGSVCPACSARWRYEVTVKPSSSSSTNPFLSPRQTSHSDGLTSATPKWANPSSTPSFSSMPSKCDT